MVIGINASVANKDKKTGEAYYAFAIIEHLKKIVPPDVQVILYSNTKLQGSLADLPDNWSEKILRWPLPKFWAQLRLSLEMLLHKPDVLFLPNHVRRIYFLPKTVMMIHDIAAAKFPTSYSKISILYSLQSAQYALSHFWHILTPSQFTKDELLKTFGSTYAEKIHVINHGFKEQVALSLDSDMNESVLAHYQIDKPYFLSISRLEEKKNTWRIIKAFDIFKQHNSEAKLVLVGQPGFGYEKVQQAIEESPYKKDIIIPGWVEEKDLPQLLHGAQGFVFPSLYEGFGLPVLDAFAAGLPVIASRGNSLEEVGGDACLYVDPFDIHELAQAMDNIWRDNALRAALKHKSTEQLKKFSWQKSAQETLDVLLSL